MLIKWCDALLHLLLCFLCQYQSGGTTIIGKCPSPLIPNFLWFNKHSSWMIVARISGHSRFGCMSRKCFSTYHNTYTVLFMNESESQIAKLWCRVTLNANRSTIVQYLREVPLLCDSLSFALVFFLVSFFISFVSILFGFSQSSRLPGLPFIFAPHFTATVQASFTLYLLRRISWRSFYPYPNFLISSYNHSRCVNCQHYDTR